MDNLNDIGKRIRNQRKKIGYNVDRVAEETGINRATLYRYENGDIAKVPIDVIRKIAGVLKTTPAYIMGWEEIKQVAEKEYYSSVTPSQKINMQERTLTNVKGWFGEKAYTLLVDYLNCNEKGKCLANERLIELVKLHPKNNKTPN